MTVPGIVKSEYTAVLALLASPEVLKSQSTQSKPIGNKKLRVLHGVSCHPASSGYLELCRAHNFTCYHRQLGVALWNALAAPVAVTRHSSWQTPRCRHVPVRQRWGTGSKLPLHPLGGR